MSPEQQLGGLNAFGPAAAFTGDFTGDFTCRSAWGFRRGTNWLALILCSSLWLHFMFGLVWACLSIAVAAFEAQMLHFHAFSCSVDLSIRTSHWHLVCSVSEQLKAPFHGTCISLWDLSGLTQDLYLSLLALTCFRCLLERCLAGLVVRCPMLIDVVVTDVSSCFVSLLLMAFLVLVPLAPAAPAVVGGGAGFRSVVGHAIRSHSICEFVGL